MIRADRYQSVKSPDLQGACPEVSPRDVTAELVEHREVLGGLDPFSDGLHVKAVREANDAGHDRVGTGVGGHAGQSVPETT